MNITILILAFSLFGSVNESETRPDEGAAWKALNAAVQQHNFPARGRFQRLPAPDFKEQLAKLDRVVELAKGTSAEPIALYYRGNTLFFLERFADAHAIFKDIKSRFPKHGLCRSLATSPRDTAIAIDIAIADCESEIELRKVYTPQALPAAVLDQSAHALFHTSMGDFSIYFYREASPKSVANFKKLVKEGFYNDLYFHEVITLQRVSTGCPNTRSGNRPRTDDGQGSPGYDLPLELNSATHEPGAVSLRRLPGNDRSHGSQFSLCVNRQPELDNVQAVIGRVTMGLDVVRKMSQQRGDDSNNPYDKISIHGVEWVESD